MTDLTEFVAGWGESSEPRLTYSLLLCPVCLDQVENDPEYGAGCYHEEYGGNVDAIEVEVLSLDRMDLYPKRDLALFRLQEDRREAAFRLAEKRWYENLDVAGRFWEDQRRKRVRREEFAEMTPSERAVASLGDAWLTPPDLSRQLFFDRPLLHQLDPAWQQGGRRGGELDEWLAGDAQVPQVAIALGLEPSHVDAMALAPRI